MALEIRKRQKNAERLHLTQKKARGGNAFYPKGEGGMRDFRKKGRHRVVKKNKSGCQPCSHLQGKRHWQGRATRGSGEYKVEEGGRGAEEIRPITEPSP